MTSKTRIAEHFNQGGMGRIIPGFPYPRRFCSYCEQDLELQSAIHVQGEEHYYKALYYCTNENCGAYDEEAGMTYARVYYSDQEAFKRLETQKIWYPTRKVVR